MTRIIYQTDPASTSLANLKAASIFFVIIPAAKPYLLLLARSITSSNVLNFKIVWTGPKI